MIIAGFVANLLGPGWLAGGISSEQRADCGISEIGATNDSSRNRRTTQPTSKSIGNDNSAPFLHLLLVKAPRRDRTLWAGVNFWRQVPTWIV